MAEALLRDRAAAAGAQLETWSRGTAARVGDPASPAAIRVLAEIGIDLSAHQSAPVSDEDIDLAHHVLVMEKAHASWLREHHPKVGERLLLFGWLAGVEEIDDPYGAWFDRTYCKTRDLLDRGVLNWLARATPSPLDAKA